MKEKTKTLLRGELEYSTLRGTLRLAQVNKRVQIDLKKIPIAVYAYNSADLLIMFTFTPSKQYTHCKEFADAVKAYCEKKKSIKRVTKIIFNGNLKTQNLYPVKKIPTQITVGGKSTTLSQEDIAEE